MKTKRQIKRYRDRMIALVEETAAHYNILNRSFETGVCKYSCSDPNRSEGCAIGRKLSKKVKKWLLETMCDERKIILNQASWPRVVGIAKRDGLKVTPQVFKNLSMSFLCELQSLHDQSDNWDKLGLSKTGKKFKDNFILDIKKGNYDPRQN